MNQPTRMWKTLGYLAVAMWGTAALLSWVAPPQASTGLFLSPDQIARLAQQAVVEGVVMRHGLWSDVEIAPARVDAAQDRMLTATAPVATWHFLVDQSGRPSCSRDWQAQRPAATGTVRILVATPDGDQPMSAAQWLCARAIVEALNDPSNSGNVILPVRLDQALARTPGVVTEAYLHMPTASETEG